MFNSKALLDDAHEKLTALWYQYAQILGEELNFSWNTANNALFACYVGEDHTETEDVQLLHAAREAVNSLGKACSDVAERWTNERSQQPPIKPEDERQEIDENDRKFINEMRGQLANMTPKVGQLDFHAETGTEGAYWSIEVDELEGYDALRIINGGNRLVLTESDDSVFFDEILIEDHDSCWRPYQPDKPYGLGQQECGGLWVHWIPKGRSSQEWATLFATAKARKMKARLYQLPNTSKGAKNESIEVTA